MNEYEKYKTALGMALSALEKAVCIAVNIADDEALQHLQTCTNELFRRAELCRREGKLMEISNDDANETNDGDTLH